MSSDKEKSPKAGVRRKIASPKPSTPAAAQAIANELGDMTEQTLRCRKQLEKLKHTNALQEQTLTDGRAKLSEQQKTLFQMQKQIEEKEAIMQQQKQHQEYMDKKFAQEVREQEEVRCRMDEQFQKQMQLQELKLHAQRKQAEVKSDPEGGFVVSPDTDLKGGFYDSPPGSGYPVKSTPAPSVDGINTSYPDLDADFADGRKSKHRYRGKLQHFDRFDPKDPYIEDWISEVSRYAQSYFEHDGDRTIFMWGLLNREVKRDVSVRAEIGTLTCVQLCTELRKLYSRPRSETELRTDFHMRRQKKGESLWDYSTALTERALQLRDRVHLGHAAMDSLLKEQFARGVSDPGLSRELVRILREHFRVDFAGLRKKADEWLSGSDQTKKVSTHVSQVHAEDGEEDAATADINVQYAFKSRVDGLERTMKTQQSTLERIEKSLGELATAPKREVPTCGHCGKRGHPESRCFKKQAAERTKKTPAAVKSTIVDQNELNQEGLQ